MTDALIDEMVRDSIRRMASGEQVLTKAQLAMVAEMEVGRKTREKEAVEAKRLGRGPDQLRGALKELVRRIKDFEDRMKIIESRVEKLLGQVSLRMAGGKAALLKAGEAAMLKKLVEVEAKQIRGAMDRLITDFLSESKSAESTPERRALKRMRDEARRGKLP